MTEKIKGRWWDIKTADQMRHIEARYDRIRDWRMDPKGYFLIKIDAPAGLIRVGYCTPNNTLQAEIAGRTALEIVNTLIREGMISSLQHAGDMGIELCKAELALRHNLTYIQDDPLSLSV